MDESLRCINCKSKEFSIFNYLKEDSFDTIEINKTVLKFKKKDLLFEESEEIAGFFCIKKGLVRTFKSSELGREQTFKIKKSGDWVGFKNLMSDSNYTHSAICIEDSEICFIEKNTVENLLATSLEFNKVIIKYLSKQLLEYQNQMFSIGTKQIHNRLAELLITLSKENSSELEFNLTREVMASCIGTTSESLIRALSDFKERNWIQLDKNKIKILDREALESLSN